jgi:HEAT repeat protein
LAALRKRTLTEEDRETIRGLLGKLTAGDFATREAASKKLFALGRRSLTQLREAVKEKDPEVSRRAKQLIERIEQEPSHHLPKAVVRLLAVRKPAGSVAALLDYLPFSENDNLTTEVQKSLGALALRDGKLDPILLRTLADAKPDLRAIAAEALVQGGGDEGRDAARKLFKDKDPVVRMRVALALAMARERDGVSVMIDLLPVLSAERVGQVEDALYQLAGDTAPDVSLGTEPAEKKKCRDAWAAWWKVNAPRVDLARLTTHPTLGLIILCSVERGRVFAMDRRGRERWSIEVEQGCVDAVVLPGRRVLLAENNANRVTERDFQGNILWQKPFSAPANVQRLPSGNTFIAGPGYIVELDRAGKEVYSLTNVPGGVLAAYRSRKGHLVCLTQNGQCLFLDTAGKVHKSFVTGHDDTLWSGLDLLPNDHVLVPLGKGNKVVEFDGAGRKVWEAEVQAPTAATKLPNGHVLATSRFTQRLVELDRAGKVVWEYKNAGRPYRARPR